MKNKDRYSKFSKSNEARALWRNAPMAPRKLRLVADHIRNLPVDQAMLRLSCSPHKGAAMFRQLLETAMANAEHNKGADVDIMRVTTVCVDGARTMKRLRPRARGRADRILKRTSHIMLEVAEVSEVRRGT